MPPKLSHVGMTVGNITEAIEFYRNVFGCQPLGEPLHVKRDGSFRGEMYRKCLDEQYGESYMVFMTLAEHAVLELFEYVTPSVDVKTDNYRYWESGVSHICLVQEDIEEAIDKIVKHGGRDRTGVIPMFESSEAKLAFCEDPWGNLIELFNVDNPGLFAAAIEAATREAQT